MCVVNEDRRPARYGQYSLHSTRRRFDFSEDSTRFFDWHALAKQQGKYNHRIRDIEFARQWQSDFAVTPRTT
jgi:hypothetical protein